MKPYGIRKCEYCGKQFEIFHRTRLYKNPVFCSRFCLNEYKKEQNKNCICSICGKKFHVKPYHKNKCKNNYCSRECFAKAKKEYMKGEGNHQFGLKGSLNASWKSDSYISSCGYRYIRCENHPFKNKNGFMLEHRLIAEKYLLNEENSIEIDGKKYLKPELVVHHKDENKLNNNPNNLEIMTLQKHESLHSSGRRTKKVEKLDLNGRTIKIYNSIVEAARENNASPQNICRACKTNKKSKGFLWKYYENN